MKKQEMIDLREEERSEAFRVLGQSCRLISARFPLGTFHDY